MSALKARQRDDNFCDFGQAQTLWLNIGEVNITRLKSFPNMIYEI